MWWALRTYAPLVHAPTGPPWSFGARPMFRSPPMDGPRLPHADALRHLIVRYLAGFGPASVADFAQFSLTKISVARAAFDGMRNELIAFPGPEGAELFDVAGTPAPPDPDRPTPPRLMAMWDSVLLAYADRDPAVYRRYGRWWDQLPAHERRVLG